jgi:hypothetical protein
MEKSSMHTQDIILLNGFRFFKDMLCRIIAKTPGLRIVADETEPGNFARVLKSTDPDWIVFMRGQDEDVPQAVNDYIQNNISKHLMIIEPAESKVRMKWYQSHEVELSQKNLHEILQILLENNPAEA